MNVKIRMVMAVTPAVVCLLIAASGCGQRADATHAKMMSAADYQQNIAKINTDPNMSAYQKQVQIEEFKEHIKVAPDGQAQ